MNITEFGRIGFLLLIISIIMLVLEIIYEPLKNNYYNIPLVIIATLGFLVLLIRNNYELER